MKFNFQNSSGWTLETELKCFLIFKKLEEEGFPRGMQTQLCEEMAADTPLTFNTISAKVGNYKSEAGVTKPSNSSEATVYLSQMYGHMSRLEVEALLEGYMLGKSNL